MLSLSSHHGRLIRSLDTSRAAVAVQPDGRGTGGSFGEALTTGLSGDRLAEALRSQRDRNQRGEEPFLSSANKMLIGMLIGSLPIELTGGTTGACRACRKIVVRCDAQHLPTWISPKQ